MTENENGHQGRKPDFIAYQVQETQDGKGIWNRIGAAWRHKDGQGMEVSLNSLPVNGRVTLRTMREERMQDYADERGGQAPQRENPPRRGYSRSR
ncbi:MAG: hypothetical protein L0Y39_11460 [Methylococcaceae bacterium]|nr:hypothetical protein [Methylococcaceae bacterium]MCI0667484.1 hypothetical protein [Methylococcaceae bacterium]